MRSEEEIRERIIESSREMLGAAEKGCYSDAYWHDAAVINLKWVLEE